MGDEILKKYFIAIFIAISVPCLISAKDMPNSSDASMKNYDDLFKKIGETRVGISDSDLDVIQNPFVTMQDDKNATVSPDSNVSVVKEFSLDAIFNNKVKIDGQWYSKNDFIEFYQIKKIKAKSVILESESESKELWIRTNNDSNIKIFTK